MRRMRPTPASRSMREIPSSNQAPRRMNVVATLGQPRNANLGEPLSQRVGDELGAVVAADAPWNAPHRE